MRGVGWRGLALIVLAAILATGAACQDRNRGARDGADRPSPPEPAGDDPTPGSDSAATNVPDSWLGQWNGPEGTFLLLARSGDQYVVTIQSLDGQATYEGIAVGDHIEFVRNGKAESIRAGDGKETGMKWLLEKKDCLIIREEEGFCRD